MALNQKNRDLYYINNRKIDKRTIPLRVDTLNNKSVNPRGCFAL